MQRKKKVTDNLSPFSSYSNEQQQQRNFQCTKWVIANDCSKTSHFLALRVKVLISRINSAKDIQLGFFKK